MDTWILAGQSNMQGYAPLVESLSPPQPDPRVQVLSSSGDWTDATEPVHRLWESYTPVHRELQRLSLPLELAELSDDELARRDRKNPALGASLAPAFAMALADRTGGSVGLIPCAHGGTSLDQWMPGHGGAERTSVHTLYGSMMDRVARARTRPDVTVRGLLWYQGESDASPLRSRGYGERFAHWVTAVRADLGESELPVVTVQLGRLVAAVEPGDLTEAAWDAVREAQRVLPASVTGVSMVSAVDLGLSDPIHIGGVGLARLGRRMAVLAHERRSGPDVERVILEAQTSNQHLVLRVSCTGVTGGWRSASFLPGFAFSDREGSPIGRLRAVDARPDPRDPASIVVVVGSMQRDDLLGAYLTYGQGFDPVCLAVDEADLPLPAFGPQPIGRATI